MDNATENNPELTKMRQKLEFLKAFLYETCFGSTLSKGRYCRVCFAAAQDNYTEVRHYDSCELMQIGVAFDLDLPNNFGLVRK